MLFLCIRGFFGPHIHVLKERGWLNSGIFSGQSSCGLLQIPSALSTCSIRGPSWNRLLGDLPAEGCAGTGPLERQMGHMMTDLDQLHLAENRPME